MPRFFIFSVSFFFVLGSVNLRFAPFSLSSLLANSLFLEPNYALLAPKIPLFNGHFALFGHVFNGTKGEYLYHCRVYLCLIGLHLAAFCLAFSTKTYCI